MDTSQRSSVAISNYVLKWKHHDPSLISAIFGLLKKDYLTDVTLFCEGHEVKAHKIILAAASDHFRELFRDNSVSNSVVFMCETKLSDLHKILEFIYKGETRVTSTDVANLLALASSLRINGLGFMSEQDKMHLEQKLTAKNQTEKLFPTTSRPSTKTVECEIGRISYDDYNEPQKTIATQSNSTTKIDYVKPMISMLSLNKNFMGDEVKTSHLDTKISFCKSKTTLCSSVCGDSNLPNEALMDVGAADDALSKARTVEAFLMFAAELRSHILQVYKNESPKDITTRLKNLWNSLSNGYKEKYYKGADESKTEAVEKTITPRLPSLSEPVRKMSTASWTHFT